MLSVDYGLSPNSLSICLSIPRLLHLGAAAAAAASSIWSLAFSLADANAAFFPSAAAAADGDFHPKPKNALFGRPQRRTEGGKEGAICK